MRFMKVALLLSFLALCQRSQGEAISPKTDKYLKCLNVVTDVSALLIENSVTAAKVLADCVSFQPTIPLTGSIVRFIKLAHQFVKRSIYDKPECLVGMFTTAVSIVRPAVARFDALKCFD